MHLPHCFRPISRVAAIIAIEDRILAVKSRWFTVSEFRHAGRIGVHCNVI